MKIYYRVNSNATSTLACWRRHANDCDITSGALDGRACNVVPCTQRADQGNDFELIQTVQMESQHSVGAPTSRDFPRFVIISQISRPELGSCWRCSRNSWPFLDKEPLWANFQKCFLKGFTTSQIDVLCANFVKFGWLEIGKVVRYLRHKKKFWLAVPLSLLRGSRPKSARASSRQYTRSAPNFIQIRSLPAELQLDAWTSLKRAIKCFQYSAKLQLQLLCFTYQGPFHINFQVLLRWLTRARRSIWLKSTVFAEIAQNSLRIPWVFTARTMLALQALY